MRTLGKNTEIRKNYPEDPGTYTNAGEDSTDVNSRSECRNKHKELRRMMSAEEVAEKSACICAALEQAPWYVECSIIYGYYPLQNEVDCRSFLEQALADKKTVALPRMTEKLPEYAGNDGKTSKNMDFYRILSLAEVASGSFHVMEPVAACPKVTEEHAVVLVPGVVFGRDGNRYGYGKGYYDRYFARFPELYKVGLAYENQMEPELTVLDTDVCMNAICTEQGFIYLSTFG